MSPYERLRALGLDLPGVPAPELGPWSLRTKTAYYYLVLVATVLVYVVCRRLVRSRVGRAMARELVVP